jgi:hypothetical protein
LGGAIFNDSGTITVENSTFFNNFVAHGASDSPYPCGDSGGAIFSRNGSLTVLNSTISGNQATGAGGGIVVMSDNKFSITTATLNLYNTIIANNGGTECSLKNRVNTSGDSNLITNNSGCPGLVSKNDPLLGSLQLNSPGTTPTMAIDSTSPAYDAGVDLTKQGITTDQRGVLRPQNVAFDIGAYELLVNRPPVAQCQDVTVQAGANCTADASIDAGSHDPDLGDSITLSQSPAGPYSLGTTAVTLTVTDSHGLTATCNGTVTVVDNTAPSINCPSNIHQPTDPGKCTAVVTFAPSATDNCSSVTLACLPASGSVFPIGSTTVQCQASDASNNSSSCSFTVTVFVGNRCPHPQGYWKNNPGLWPASALPMTLGRQTYSKTELLAILSSPSTADASIILARQLIAAILNTANGSAPTPICASVAQVQTLLSSLNGKLPYKLSPSSAKGNALVNISSKLDSYNNDLLTPGCVP